MKPTRTTSLRLLLGWTLAVLAAAAMWMSWGALYETAIAVGGMSPERAVVFPVIIDVVTIAAMLIALLGKSRAWVAWITLVVFGLLTVAGNAAHVVTVDPSHLAMGVGVGILVNSIPGVALLMVTHLAAVTVFTATTTTETATSPTVSHVTIPPTTEPSRPTTTAPARSKWGDDKREQAIALAPNHSISQIVELVGVPRSTVARWISA